MPDLLNIFSKRWKFIIGLSFAAAIVALIITLLMPKEYLSTATALPSNSLVADKSRISGTNIQELYSDFGTPDELDRMEGTALLDTVMIAVSKEQDLAHHYFKNVNTESFYKAAMKLRKNSRISQSGYGELKIKVWDENRDIAAALANSILDKVQAIQVRLQNQNNETILEQLRKDHAQKQQSFYVAADSMTKTSGAGAEIWQSRKTTLLSQLSEDEKMIEQYELAVNTAPKPLLVVERASASLYPDRPDSLPAVLAAFFAALAFSFLLSLFLESRKLKP